jgi:hypothetical protein
MTLPEENAPNILIVIAGSTALAGSLDIADALVFYGVQGVSPVRLLQGIATGVLGRAAFKDGLSAALLGITVHFLIACIWVTVYLLASRHLPLFRHPFLYGILYGLVIYAVMNYVVLPLSRTGRAPLLPPLLPLLNGVAALVVCIGIPVARLSRHYVPYHGSNA